MAISPRLHRRLRGAARLGNVELLRSLLRRGADPNVLMDDPHSWASRTVLMRAVEGGHGDCVRVLLAHGARTEEIAGCGKYTALVIAVERGDPELVQMLVEGGAQLETAVIDGMTPLMIAVRCSRLRIVEALLAAGADPAAMTRWTAVQRSVRDIARETFERRQQGLRALQGYDTREVTLAIRREREARAIHRILEERVVEHLAR